MPPTPRPITVTDGAVLDAYEFGAGERGVVLVPARGVLGLCGSWRYGGQLAQRGLHVLLFDHRCVGRSTCPPRHSESGLMDDLQAAIRTLVRDGAQRLVLIGASQGGAEAIIAGARRPDGVVGVVALSADQLDMPLAAVPYPTTATAAARALTLPSLFAVSSDDLRVSVEDTRALVNAVPGHEKRLIVLPDGHGHGWDLLDTGAAPAADIDAFLSAELEPPPPPCPGAPPARVLHAGTIPVEVLGTGPAAVVLSNQSDEGRCSWLPFATTLLGQGFRVALWDCGGADAPNELSAVAAAVHADGATRVVLAGASKGAKASLAAARRMAMSYVVGVVCLSAEATLLPGIDVAAQSAGLSVPVLLVTSTGDPYGSAGALDPIARGIARAQILRVPGAAHGTALLDSSRVVGTVIPFLRRVAE